MATAGRLAGILLAAALAAMAHAQGEYFKLPGPVKNPELVLPSRQVTPVPAANSGPTESRSPL
jgi:hypothetical protein